MILKLYSANMDIQFVDGIKQFTYNKAPDSSTELDSIMIMDDGSDFKLRITDTAYLLNDEGKTIERIN